MDGSETKTPKKIKMNAGRIIALILAVLVVYCCVYSLVVKAVRNETLPMPLGFGVGVILSGSMEPTYHVNDLIFAVKAKNFKVGDIVVYQTGGTPVVHRVIEADDGSGTVITQGDANNAPDDPVVVSRIKGKVLFAVPFVGAVMRFIKTVPGMIMILIVLFLGCFSPSAQGKRRRRRNRKRRRSKRRSPSCAKRSAQRLRIPAPQWKRRSPSSAKNSAKRLTPKKNSPAGNGL